MSTSSTIQSLHNMVEELAERKILNSEAYKELLDGIKKAHDEEKKGDKKQKDLDLWRIVYIFPSFEAHNHEMASSVVKGYMIIDMNQVDDDHRELIKKNNKYIIDTETLNNATYTGDILPRDLAFTEMNDDGEIEFKTVYVRVASVYLIDAKPISQLTQDRRSRFCMITEE